MSRLQHYTELVGEPALRSVKHGDIIQLQRKGFFICDRAYEECSPYSGTNTPMILIAIPDGKETGQAKESSTASKTESPVDFAWFFPYRFSVACRNRLPYPRRMSSRLSRLTRKRKLFAR